MAVITKDSITQILREAADLGANEIHFKVPKRPQYRIDGSLLPSRHPRLLPQDTREVGNSLMMMAKDVPLPQATSEANVSFGVSGLGRYRATIYQQRGTLAILIAAVPTEAPTLAELGFDSRMERFIGQRGLILVGGGRKRMLLLSSMVTNFNASHRGHVVFLEDSLSVLHRDAMASIAHREVGVDVDSFAHGIEAAIRDRADLLVINRIQDADTAHAMLTAAEEGIPTIACVAAPTAADAPHWVARNFTGDRRQDAKDRMQRLVRMIVALPDDGRPELRTTRPASPARNEPKPAAEPTPQATR